MEVILLIALTLATVGVIYYKKDREQIRKEYEEERQRCVNLQGKLSSKLYDEENWLNIRCKELTIRNIELIKILKAILVHSENYKVQIDAKDLREEIKGEVYQEFDMVTPTYTIKLIPNSEKI